MDTERPADCSTIERLDRTELWPRVGHVRVDPLLDRMTVSRRNRTSALAAAAEW